MDLYSQLFALYGRDVIEITLFVGMEIAGYKALVRLLQRPVKPSVLAHSRSQTA